MSVVMLFPGQNSRYPAMIEKLMAWDTANGQWVGRASEILGRDLGAHYVASNPDIFARNQDVQIGVFLASHLRWQYLEQAGIRAEYSAGLSLGEYNHLTHIGAIVFDDAIRVLQARGEAYEAGPRGKMAAVFPITSDDLAALVSASGYEGRVAIGMENTPRQCVLSGDAAAVDAVAGRAEEEYLTETVVIENSLPMHSPLYAPVGERLRPALERAAWRTPDRPYLPNLTGRFATNPGPAFFIETLSKQPWHTVRWRESMETLGQACPEAVYVEAGPRAVLTHFFGRKWLNPRRFATDADENTEASLMNLIQELERGSTRARGAD